jgi:hypothetical protein
MRAFNAIRLGSTDGWESDVVTAVTPDPNTSSDILNILQNYQKWPSRASHRHKPHVGYGSGLTVFMFRLLVASMRCVPSALVRSVTCCPRPLRSDWTTSRGLIRTSPVIR